MRRLVGKLPTTAATRNHARKALVAWHQYLTETGEGSCEGALALAKLREPRAVPKALSDSQADAVWRAARRDTPEAHALIALLLYGGLRITEARTLSWDNVAGHWVTFTGKGGQQRAVPLHSCAVTALGQLPARTSWVLPSPYHIDKPVSDPTARKWVRHVGEAAGIESLRPHTLRHTAATGLLEAGADVATVADLLGHQSLATTRRYLRVRDSRLRSAVDALPWAG